MEIIADLLSAVQRRSKKTHIMYESNLGYNLLMKYLNLLLENNLVRKREDEKYEISSKGEQFLEEYKILLEKERITKEYLREVMEIRGKLEEFCLVNY